MAASDSTVPSASRTPTSTASAGLAWAGLTYDIPLPRKQRKAAVAAAADTEAAKPTEGPRPGFRRLLDGVSGFVQRGEMVAILGASGAGKTTCLNVISGRLDSTGDLSGQVHFEGAARRPSDWKRTVGFVEQDDLMYGQLTVAETLQYSASLRLPDALYTNAQKSARVVETIDMLRLDKCRDTRIGDDQVRGISGGERKRTAIGVELVSDVSVLLLDEPTSGLDSYAAYSVVDNLRDVTRTRNLACLMTIHQPSFRVFSLFDRVILLTRGGVFYAGPPADALAYFEGLGHRVPDGMNPADYFITIAEAFEKTDEAERRVQGLLDSWRAHETREKRESGVGLVIDDTARDAQRAYTGWPSAWFRELQTLTSRNFVQTLRNPRLIVGTFAQTVALLFFIGFAFFRLGTSQSDVLGRIGVLFIIPVNASFATLFPVLSVFPLQRAIMIRERSGGLYRTSAFYLAKVATEVPMQILQRILFYMIIYWMIGLQQTAAKYFIFIGVNLLQVLTAVGLGFLIGAGSKSIEAANIIAPMLNVIFLLFGANLLPVASIPPWYVWLHWISPIAYTYAALSLNEFPGATYDCGAETSQCFRTGDQVVAQYGLGRFSIGENAAFLAALTLVFFAGGYVILRWSAKPRFRYI